MPLDPGKKENNLYNALRAMTDGFKPLADGTFCPVSPLPPPLPAAAAADEKKRDDEWRKWARGIEANHNALMDVVLRLRGNIE